MTQSSRWAISLWVWQLGSNAKGSLDSTPSSFLKKALKKEEDSASRLIPNAICLVRNGDFLLGVLRKHEENFIHSSRDVFGLAVCFLVWAGEKQVPIACLEPSEVYTPIHLLYMGLLGDGEEEVEE